MTWKYNDEIIEESDIYDIVDREYSEDDYEGLLNEIEPTVKIGSLEYESGTVLKAVDPIAFECGRSEEVDYMVHEIIYAEESTDSYGFGIEWIEPDDEDDE